MCLCYHRAPYIPEIVEPVEPVTAKMSLQLVEFGIVGLAVAS